LIDRSVFGVPWEVVEGESLSWLRRQADRSFDAVVTSPPYGDQRSYGGAPPDEYADWIEPWLVELLRTCREAGSLMLNLGRIMRDGEEHPWALEVLMRAREVGWRWVDTIVWHKTNAMPLSHPAYLHGMHEFVWWLSPTTSCYRGYDSDTRRPHAEGTVRRIGQPYMRSKGEKGGYELHPDGARPSTVFAAGVGATRGLKHPAPMAKALALHLVSLSCPFGGIVLDPFAGAMTTGVACLERGRRFVGVEHQLEAVQEGRERLRSCTL
jgi:DNA modification methylase